jgi:serine/threonine-protein kinase
MSEIIKFIREKDFRFVQELKPGACGKTVLLYDEVIKENFVCKKFSPLSGIADRELLFEKFIQEIKILHLASHPNVVRVFNYYIYPKLQAGFIVMEHIDGACIDDYLAMFPEHIDNVFLQCLRGFEYLYELNILHRDIRPANIMVTNAGVVKIIDFGFSKPATEFSDFDKSITLNWWAAPPAEFAKGKYDFCTEIYFLGKLFQKIIIENKIEHFSYKAILAKMCENDPSNRFSKFSEIKAETVESKNTKTIFYDSEIETFRTFSTSLASIFSGIAVDAKYVTDIPTIENGLEDLYKSVMLSEHIPSIERLAQRFVSGNFKFYKSRTFEVEVLKDFLQLLRSSSGDKKNVIIRNIFSVLDSVDRINYQDKNDEIPF